LGLNLKSKELEEHAEITKRRAQLQAQLSQCGMNDEIPDGTVSVKWSFALQPCGRVTHTHTHADEPPTDERSSKPRERRWSPTCFFEPDSPKTIKFDSDKRIEWATLPKIIEKVTTPEAGETVITHTHTHTHTERQIQ
jgi:hypothetical protein